MFFKKSNPSNVSPYTSSLYTVPHYYIYIGPTTKTCISNSLHAVANLQFLIMGGFYLEFVKYSIGWYRQTCLSHLVNLLLIIPSRCFLCGSFLLFVFRVYLLYCHVCSLQPCGHLLGRTDLSALMCVMFSSVFVTFPYDAPGQVWYLNVSIPVLYLLTYFSKTEQGQDNTLSCIIIRISVIYLG